MLIKEAKKIIISLSKPEKMPGYAYGCQPGSVRQAASSLRSPARCALAVTQ
jgi:hypothetical protein